MTQNRKILKIEIVLTSGHVITTFTFADGYDVQFNEQGECSQYHLEIPDGLPVTRVAVAADDMVHAHELMDRYTIREAFSDASDDCVDVDFIKEITKLEELAVYNWDGMCLPYGDTDGNTRLKDILKD